MAPPYAHHDRRPCRRPHPRSLCPVRLSKISYQKGLNPSPDAPACGSLVILTHPSTAYKIGARMEDVQSAAGHADPSTTKLYDRRGYNPEKSASFFANY